MSIFVVHKFHGAVGKVWIAIGDGLTFTKEMEHMKIYNNLEDARKDYDDLVERGAYDPGIDELILDIKL